MRVHGGNPWALSRRLGCSPADILDFSLDINPLGYPASVRAVVLQSLDELSRYPDPDARILREALAAHHGVPIECVLPGNGSAELIGLLTRLNRVARILVIAPTFGEYAWAAEQAGASVVYRHTDASADFCLEQNPATWREWLRDVQLVFLCNPNNPTGVALSRHDVLRLAGWCREAGCRLVVDEAFADFAERPEQVSILPDACRWDHVIVLRSLTKLFAVPGLRLGYLIAAAPLVQTLRNLQSAWPLNSFAISVGCGLLQERAYIERTRRSIAQWRRRMFDALRALPKLEPFPSAVNFILCRLSSSGPSAVQLADGLAQRRFIIRTGDSFVGLPSGRFIRVAIRTPEENAQLITQLQAALTPVAEPVGTHAAMAHRGSDGG